MSYFYYLYNFFSIFFTNVFSTLNFSFYIDFIKKYFKFVFMLDHKFIGFSYIFTGIFCGLLGVYFSYLMRIELLIPSSYMFSGSEIVYNVVITSHGFIMVFYAAMPILINGVGNYMIPILCGCKDMAFPRLNNIAFFFLLFSFFFFEFSFGGILFKIIGFSGGWTMYPPLSTFFDNYSVDLLIFSLHLNGISSLLNSFNLIVTSHFMSSLNLWHLPILVWSLLITSYLLIFVLPVLVVCITTLLTDHFLGSCFYSVLGGGDPVLFQHLFWFFGHPEVYILILPVFGLVSEFISEYSSFRLIGYRVMIWSMITIAVLGCFVWGHHMFTVGLEVDTQSYFTLATSLIAIPTGLKILLWLASFLNSNLGCSISIIFSFLFILTFIFGGLTGIWLAQAGLDLILHDTYFVVGHFHYVLAISLVYMFFAFVYNYLYFFTGCHFYENYAKIHLISFFIGSNLIFMPMHFLGILGMPRRIFDYPSCFIFWNQLETFGVFITFLSFLWFILALSPSFNNFFSKVFHSFLL